MYITLILRGAQKGAVNGLLLALSVILFFAALANGPLVVILYISVAAILSVSAQEYIYLSTPRAKRLALVKAFGIGHGLQAGRVTELHEDLTPPEFKAYEAVVAAESRCGWLFDGFCGVTATATAILTFGLTWFAVVNIL